MFDVHFFVNPAHETTPKWYGLLMIKLTAFQASGWARMKLQLFRQDLQDYQDFFGLVELYPVHHVDPVRKWKDHYPSCSLDLSAYLIGKLN
jgi:hypothetical protein